MEFRPRGLRLRVGFFVLSDLMGLIRFAKRGRAVGFRILSVGSDVRAKSVREPQLVLCVRCPVGKHLQNLRDEAHRVGQHALSALKMAPTHKRKTDALDKAVLAEMAHDELISHVASCKTCSGKS
jgi:hypothetical protein